MATRLLASSCARSPRRCRLSVGTSPACKSARAARALIYRCRLERMDAQRFRDEQRALRELVGERRRRSARETAGAGSTPPRATPPLDGPLVSVIVVCWNAAEVLGRCLDRLFAQDYANREIVVVDDGSTDATVDVARAASTRGELTLVQSPRNRGCPSARNRGLDRARGEIVAFIDADGFATPSWLSGIVRTFAADRTIGGVASTVFYDDNPMVVNGAGGAVNRQGWAADLSMNESFECARLAARGAVPDGLRHGRSPRGARARRTVRRPHAQLLRRRRLRRAAVARRLQGARRPRRLDRSRRRRRATRRRSGCCASAIGCASRSSTLRRARSLDGSSGSCASFSMLHARCAGRS